MSCRGIAALPQKRPNFWSILGSIALNVALAEVGGQNFLEPLTFGVVPVIGPSWSNFAWVGQEIFELGLVRQAADWQGALEALTDLAASPPPRAAVQARAEAYAQSRKGGAAAVCQMVAESLFWE